MSVDMTKWQAIAKENVHNRPAGEGRLAGKITIVTGAAQGFGKGIAEELYKEGATIVIADMNLPLAETVAKEMGDRAWAIGVNVSDEESCAEMVAKVVEKFGGLDIMVANAGVVRSGPIAEFEKKDFEFVTAINYTGLFLTCKYAAIIMEAQHEADPEGTYDIIAMSSKSGNYLDGPLWSDPERGLFVQYLQAGKVPGAKTVEDVRRFYESKVPMNRGCLPIDVARAVMYCVEQKYETGQAIPVTGGQVMLN